MKEAMKYECNEKVDGEKVYNYFNPPLMQSVSGRIGSKIGNIIFGIIFIVLAGVAKKKLSYLMMPGTLPYKIDCGVVIVGVFLIALGIIGLLTIKRYKEKLDSKTVTDADYDKMVYSILQEVKQKGMDALNLDEDEIKEAEPLVLHRYAQGEDVKKCEDGQYRGSVIESTVFYFTIDTLYVYKYSFSMKNKVTNEETFTIFYKDIVSVRVGAIEDKAGEENYWGLKQLTMATSGGQTVSYMFASSDSINAKINAMQSLFREKKKEI